MQKIIKELIEEEKSTYFNDLDEVVEVFGPVIIADFFVKLNCNNKAEPNYIYNDNKLYCYKNCIWIQSNNELRDNVKNIISNFKIYNYLVKPIKKQLNSLVEK